MQEGFRVLVLHRDRVVVSDLCRGYLFVNASARTLHQERETRRTFGESGERAVLESLLKRRAHELVPGARFRQDGKVNPKPKKVHDRRHDDEPERSRQEMFRDMLLWLPSVSVDQGSFSEGKEEAEGMQRTIECPRLMSNRFHRSTTTAVPTARKANNPTILHEMVKERKTPVKSIHVHHGFVNSLSCPREGVR